APGDLRRFWVSDRAASPNLFSTGSHQETGSNSCHEVSWRAPRELPICLFFLENALARKTRIWKVPVLQNLTVKVSYPVLFGIP
ncbi:hypothetical protein Nmel_014131, partial [Mimus melanotis]